MPGIQIVLNRGSLQVKHCLLSIYLLILRRNVLGILKENGNLSMTWLFIPNFKLLFLLEHTLYNMSLDEMVNAIEPDSTLRTGSGFPGVWTRDVSYSIILSMAYMQPKVSMNCLLRKVDRFGRIIQDTGTGGSWPCSTDRMIWAVAAWEIYKVTGSREWLEKVYPIIRKSVEDDYLTVYDEKDRAGDGRIFIY